MDDDNRVSHAFAETEGIVRLNNLSVWLPLGNIWQLSKNADGARRQ
jgi:hypothetical protein